MRNVVLLPTGSGFLTVKDSFEALPLGTLFTFSDPIAPDLWAEPAYVKVGDDQAVDIVRGQLATLGCPNVYVYLIEEDDITPTEYVLRYVDGHINDEEN